PDAEEARLPEAHQPRLSHEQLERQREDGEHHHLSDEVHHELPARERDECQREHGRGEDSGPRAPRRHAALNRPSGRHSSTSAITTYTSTPAACGKNPSPKVSTAPTSSAAANAPRTDPMPPITTTTKQMISTWLPMPGYTEDTGAASMPASTASATPAA